MVEDASTPALECDRLDPSKTEWLAAANVLLNRTQGDGLFSVEDLLRRLRLPGALGLALLDQGTLVAAGFAAFATSLDYYHPFGPNIAQRLAGKKIGSLSTVSVEEDWQGRGLGQQLAHKRLNHLRSIGCDWVLSVSWVSGQAHTSRHVFDKLGFRRVGEAAHFFREWARAHPFDCPGCRQQPCVCSAILFELDLRSGVSGSD